MPTINVAQELSDAQARADELIGRKHWSVEEAATVMASEFHLCIYAAKGLLWASWVDGINTRYQSL